MAGGGWYPYVEGDASCKLATRGRRRLLHSDGHWRVGGRGKHTAAVAAGSKPSIGGEEAGAVDGWAGFGGLG